MPKNNCLFQQKWLEDDRFKHWIRKKDDTIVKCSYCCKDVSVANMGEAALTSHMKGKKHIEKSPSDESIKTLMPPTSAPTPAPGNVSECANEPEKQKTVDKMLINVSTFEAEIRWVLNIVYSKYSMNSSTDSGKLFRSMFPDSDIAKSFQCGPTKAGYVATFGLSIYFQNLLLSTLSTVPYYTVSFDESLNPIFQKGQMDLLVRFWDDKADMVSTRYLKSEFMGRATAVDVLQTFSSGISDIDKSKILQVSSDGPNVNLLFLNNLTEQRKEEELDPLIDIGTCGLHTIHGSLKAGAKASDWGLNNILKAMWQFLHDSPSRRATYENITETLDYPLKFCGHRWCENEACAQKAETLIDGYKKFVTYISTLTKSKQPDPSNKSWQRLKTMIHNPVLPAQLKFFEMVSGKLNAFLRGFQTDKPMVPFMTTILGDIVYDLLNRIILKDVLSKNNTLYKKLQLDLTDKNIRKPSKYIDIGFAAQLKLNQANLSSSDQKVVTFKKEAGEFLAGLLSHLLGKSPLKFIIVRTAVSINPIQMANQSKRNACIENFSTLLQKLVIYDRFSPKSAELAKKQYQKLFEIVDSNRKAFQDFDLNNDRLDRFFSDFIGTNRAYEDVWSVFKLVFVLSHGQSSIERGFSINKQLLVENLKEKSLIALRLIEDHMSSFEETPESIKINREMVQNVKRASSRYREDLQSQREQKESNSKELKRKIVDEEMKAVRAKRRILQSEIESLTEESDKLAMKAEKNSNLDILKESNKKKKLRNAKQKEIKELDVMENNLSQKK
jgi:hypothetical protein